MLLFKKLLSRFFRKPEKAIIPKIRPVDTIHELKFRQIPFFNADIALRPGAAQNDLIEALRYMDGKKAVLDLVDTLITAAPVHNFELYLKIRDQKFNLVNSSLLTGEEIKKTPSVNVASYHGHRFIKESVFPTLINPKITS